MRILVTGVSGYVGGALVPRLVAEGHEIRGFARTRERVTGPARDLGDVVLGDAETGVGLDRALDGIDVAYYLLHSMAGPDHDFPKRELKAAENFAGEAAAGGVRRIVYLGGLLPQDTAPSRHLASRLAVEDELLASVAGSIAFRASIVIGGGSRSFRFIVRLVERMPIMALPPWRDNRTQPMDGRDLLEFLVAAADAPPELSGRSWDIAGPEVMTYAEMIDRLSDILLIKVPRLPLGFSITPIAAVLTSALTGEDPGLVGPLMESLEHDLLPRDDTAAAAFGVRLHDFDSAVERALRELEDEERRIKPED